VKGFEILDVFYPHVPNLDSDNLAFLNAPVWKSILVKVGPDQYREIYHYQGTESEADGPSSLIGPVLQTERRLGLVGRRIDEFFWFDESGSTHIDQAMLAESAKTVVPNGDDTCTGYGLFATSSSPAVVFHMPTSRPGIARCGGPGEVEVKLAMVKRQLIVTNVRYVRTRNN
jgi:hypothetical protein